MNRLIVQGRGEHVISRHLYGHFAEHLGRCIYDGLWVGEDSDIPHVRGIRADIVEALRKIKAPNLRWPGGCFADYYHWRDGVGPRDRRPTTVNYVWAGQPESNHFGTHEYFDLCEQLGCEPHICGNIGDGTVQEMQQWVEYITSQAGPMADLRRANGRAEPWRVRFWDVGNEVWGLAGWMRAQQYADEYRRHATYLRNHSGNVLYKVACGPEGPNYDWTEVLLKEAAAHMQGLSFHFYCGFGWCVDRAEDFREDGWFRLLQDAVRTDEMLTRHSAIMDRYDPQRRIGLIMDEWGTWHNSEPGTVLYQQNTLRDAMVAGVTLNILNRHAARVQAACIAQAVNVLQAMVLTQGPRMLLTPTYHVFDMYAGHHNATLLPIHLACRDYRLGDAALPAISASASLSADRTIRLSLCNLDPHAGQELAVEFRGFDARTVAGRVLTAPDMTARNTFEMPGAVQPQPFDGAAVSRQGVSVSLPPMSIVVLETS